MIGSSLENSRGFISKCNPGSQGGVVNNDHGIIPAAQKCAQLLHPRIIIVNPCRYIIDIEKKAFNIKRFKFHVG
jgi:hypothetical protein